jgi:mycothiol synthase
MVLKAHHLPQPPDSADYIWRPARREDAPAIQQLMLDIEAVDQRGHAGSLEERESEFDNPSLNPMTDTLLALTPQGQVAALAWVIAPPVGVQEYIAYLRGEVHPRHRRRGLGDFILTWMEARGREVLATRPDNIPCFLRTSTADFLDDRIALYEQHGFKPVRYFYRMRRDLSQPIPEMPPPQGIRLAPWDPELDSQTMETSNLAFRDHWGAIPYNEEAWHLLVTQQPVFRPDLTFLALTTGNGFANPVAGYSICRLDGEDNEIEGLKEGWIQELGVRQDWRRRGIATALLCAGMRAMKASGLEYTGLGVDTENTSGAVHIYESLGFKSVQRGITFSKPLEPVW